MLFDGVVGKPTFPADSFARIKNQMLAGFEYEKQNPGKLASLELMNRCTAITPTRIPATAGATVPAITVAQVKAFDEQALRRRQRCDCAGGDLSRAEAEAIAAQVPARCRKVRHWRKLRS